MSQLTDRFRPTLKCPNCGHQFQESLTRLKNDPVLVCPACGDSFKVESGGSARGMADALDNLDRAWNKLVKRR